ncbi:hypothetical protein M2F98_19355 [Vibrio vulnificus]|nr:hypothetical protein [Vibrio vulnificus]
MIKLVCSDFCIALLTP